jgi:putative glutathione S-transferase
MSQQSVQRAQSSTNGASGNADGPTWQKQVRDDGEFVRRDTTFRNFISREPGAEFPAEPDRFHLYVSWACPWAHRTLIVRKLKGLSDVISYDVVDWLMPHTGWTLEAKTPGATLDTVNGKTSLRAIYQMCSPGYQGSVTVPTLWDKKKGTIVNNESSEIIRMLNTEFDQFAKHPEYDFYPEELRGEIDSINEWVYPKINNGVYQSGFARTQAAYERAAGHSRRAKPIGSSARSINLTTWRMEQPSHATPGGKQAVARIPGAG